MTDIEKLKDIIRQVKPGMSTSPEYTSGRGATLSDLNSNQLFQIQNGIKKNFGDDASKSFALMVKNIKVLSCTTFLQELYILCKNEWKLNTERKESSGVKIENELQGIVSIFESLKNNKDDTEKIRGHFLSVNFKNEGYYAGCC